MRNTENPVMLYRYFSDESKHALKNLQKGVIYFNHPDSFNDPFEFYSTGQFSKDSLFYFKVCTRVCCFTKNPLNHLMWSHYANFHKGFCVGYSYEDIEKLDGVMLKNVMYQENLPSTKVEDIPFTKSAHWSYEDEVRATLNCEPEILKDSIVYDPENSNYVLSGESMKCWGCAYKRRIPDLSNVNYNKINYNIDCIIKNSSTGDEVEQQAIFNAQKMVKSNENYSHFFSDEYEWFMKSNSKQGGLPFEHCRTPIGKEIRVKASQIFIGANANPDFINKLKRLASKHNIDIFGVKLNDTKYELEKYNLEKYRFKKYKLKRYY